jgi:hypothetical protein
MGSVTMLLDGKDPADSQAEYLAKVEHRAW